MADLFDVVEIVEKMADGFESEVLKCLGENTEDVTIAIAEQLYSGVDGDGQYLSPTYDSDPYFEQEGWWQHRSYAYKEWKNSITPPSQGYMLGLAPRPDNVPNLYINGKFYSEIFAQMQGDTLRVDVEGSGDGPDIVHKYGEQILQLSPTAIKYFTTELLIPHIWNFFAECGY